MNLSVADIFIPGHKIILSLQDARYPLRFHPWVRSADARQVGLELPDRWWQLTAFLPDMKVEMKTVREDSIYTLQGKILEVSQHPPGLLLEHGNQPERLQQRMFYRLEYRASIILSQVVLPEGTEAGPLPAMVYDISAGGLGIKTGKFLPPDTMLKIEGLLNSVIAQGAQEEESYWLRVRWCRVHRPDGYRLGARFEFKDMKEHDRMARIITQLQVSRLSRYQHILGHPGA